MINRTLARRLNQLEACFSLTTAPEDFHTLVFLGAKDETAKLTLQLGPNGAQTWTDLTDPNNPRTWTEIRR